MNDWLAHLTKTQRSVINQRAAELALQITPDIRDLLAARVVEEFGPHGLRAVFVADLAASVASITPEDVAEHLLREASK